jgi:BMFP domain-containing protein YqiC
MKKKKGDGDGRLKPQVEDLQNQLDLVRGELIGARGTAIRLRAIIKIKDHRIAELEARLTTKDDE